MVWEAQTLTDGQDWGTWKDPSKQTLKLKTPDIYKSKSHMDCYDFIQQYEDYFAISGSQDRNQIPFVATFFKEKTLNWWQVDKPKINAKTLVSPT